MSGARPPGSPGRETGPANRFGAFEHLHNFRDLGGYRGAGGRRVAWGRLYRSDSLGKLRGADWSRFGELGVRTVLDLRYPWEIARRGRVPAGPFGFANLSIEHRPYDQAGLGPEVDPCRYLADRFAEVALDGVAEIGQAIDLIAIADLPLVFHCTSGKDRTGLLAALVLTLLDVSDEDIVADFALTTLVADRLAADWRAAHPDRELRWPWYGHAPAELMRRVLAELADRYGSVLGYLTGPVGVGADTVARLRDRLLDPPDR